MQSQSMEGALVPKAHGPWVLGSLRSWVLLWVLGEMSHRPRQLLVGGPASAAQQQLVGHWSADGQLLST